MLWVNILQAAREGKVLTYQAPFDRHPTTLIRHDTPDRRYKSYKIIKGDKLRITPGSGADPFTADEGHAERMNIL